jgi:hypothetical protein
MPGNAAVTRAMTSVLLSCLAGACGDGRMTPQGPGPDASTSHDAATPRPDASPAPDGGPGPGTGIVSNTPGATVVDVGNPATPNAVLLSSNLLQRPSGGQIFQEWLGEVKNTGSTVICQVSANVIFRDASGIQLASFFTFADGDPYMVSGLTLSIGCIAPGQIGSMYDNGFVAAMVELGRVSRIEVSFSVHEYPDAVPAPHAPLVTSHQAMVFGTEFGVVGTFTGVGGPIYNIGLDVYPRTATGLVVAQLFATDLDTLEPGAAFSFMTIGTPTAFTAYRQFVEFIDGPRPAARVTDTPGPAASAAADLDARRRDHRRAVRDRLARARRSDVVP